MEEMQERAAASRANRNMARYWASASRELEVDRQGRMVLPARMREYAELDTEVVVVGVIDRVELWNPAAGRRRSDPRSNA